MTALLQHVLVLLWSGLVSSLERGFVYCPAYPCTCESKDGVLIINCRSLYLSSLPKFLSFEGRIKELSLRHNSITSLPANGFLSLNVERLDLLDNAVTFIHRDAFKGLNSSLRWLSIQLYALDGFPSLALSRLRQLRTLIILGCKLPELRADQFVNLTQLEELHLIGCRITHIQANAFSPLPHLNTLVLAKNGLRSQNIPEINRLDKLVDLDLSFNDIQVLDGSAFHRLSKLRSLKLWSNKVSHVAKSAFYGLDFSLEELNLGGNRITEEDLNSLADLKVLRRLDLSFNNISNLSGEHFTSLRYLTSLNLAYNSVKTIGRGAFRGLVSSIELIISGSPLQLIEGGGFSELRTLERLVMNSTSLGGKLRPQMFDGLPSTVSYLDVSNSSLVSGDLQAFSRLTNLSSIDLSHNNINDLDLQILRTLRNVKYANFSFNDIFAFPQIPAFGLSWRIVDLSWNRVRAIEQCSFFALQELADLRLEGNPLNCNCDLSWLYRWLQVTHLSLSQEHYRWTCDGPNSLGGHYFTQLEFSDFKCTDSPDYENNCPTLDSSLWFSGNVTESNIFQLEIPRSCNQICLNVSLLQPNSINVDWLTEDIHNIYGFKVILKRLNDSLELQSETVQASATNVTFHHDASARELQICVAVLNKDSLPLVQKCEDVPSVAISKDDESREQQLHNLIHNSFIPLMFIYIAGSLALAFIAACFVVCIRKQRRSPMRVKPLGVAYPAWLDHRTSATSSSLTHEPHFLNTLFIGDSNSQDSRSSLCMGPDDRREPSLHSPVMNLPMDFPLNFSNRRESDMVTIATDATVQLPREGISVPTQTGDDFFFHF